MSIQHPASSNQHPVLIVGGGLAGVAVAWRLWERGVRFVVVDPELSETCSKIAAGLITPITGMHLTVNWRLPELLPVAREYYRGIEREVRQHLYHEVPCVRLLKNAREVKKWESKKDAAENKAWVAPEQPNPLVNASVFNSDLGGFEQRGSGWLDTAAYLAASREFFIKQRRWQQGSVLEETLHPDQDGVNWSGETYRFVVLCRGADGQANARFFPWLEWESARGVIAGVAADADESRIINRRVWMLPRDGAWRVGSTYEFDFSAPIERSVEVLRTKLQDLLKVPFEITKAQMGIRPILKQRMLTLGTHPAHPRVAILNGLGSKGALQAPFFARMLVEHLLDGAKIDEEVDVAGNR
jgi:glycine oxidase